MAVLLVIFVLLLRQLFALAFQIHNFSLWCQCHLWASTLEGSKVRTTAHINWKAIYLQMDLGWFGLFFSSFAENLGTLIISDAKPSKKKTILEAPKHTDNLWQPPAKPVKLFAQQHAAWHFEWNNYVSIYSSGCYFWGTGPLQTVKLHFSRLGRGTWQSIWANSNIE